jgi:integrase
MKVQQELMRHSDIRTTMNVYGKAMDESKRTAHGKSFASFRLRE